MIRSPLPRCTSPVTRYLQHMVPTTYLEIAGTVPEAGPAGRCRIADRWPGSMAGIDGAAGRIRREQEGQWTLRTCTWF